MSIRIGLNIYKRDSGVFFCRECGLHLSLLKPVGVVEKITPSILRGLNSGRLIDIDKVLNKEEKKLEPVVSEVKEEIKPVMPEVKVEDKPKAKAKAKPKTKGKEDDK